jgi:Transposase
MEITYFVAGIDVHKRMLAVVIADAGREGEFGFQGRKFGTTPGELKLLRTWLSEQGVREVVMESTAQYWKPVWQELEGHCELFLAQAYSNRAPRGRKRDFADAERLLRRHVAGELILSFVPHPEQRLWRTMTRSKHQLTRDRVRLHSQIESLLEEGRIKLSGWVSDLLGVSSRRMLRALADGETEPAKLAALAAPSLRATRSNCRMPSAKRPRSACYTVRSSAYFSPGLSSSRVKSRSWTEKRLPHWGNTTTPYSGWRRFPASASIRHNRSSPRSGRRQPRFRRRNS